MYDLTFGTIDSQLPDLTLLLAANVTHSNRRHHNCSKALCLVSVFHQILFKPFIVARPNASLLSTSIRQLLSPPVFDPNRLTELLGHFNVLVDNLERSYTHC